MTVTDDAASPPAGPDQRPATPDDVGPLCLSLPEVELGTTWGDVPSFKVPRGDKGRGFLLYRHPHRTAIDPATGEPFDDLLVIRVADQGEKAALVEDTATPFFTVPHFDGYHAVLVQQSRLGELTLAELREVITEAWAAVAPKSLVKQHFADG